MELNKLLAIFIIVLATISLIYSWFMKKRALHESDLCRWLIMKRFRKKPK